MTSCFVRLCAIVTRMLCPQTQEYTVVDRSSILEELGSTGLRTLAWCRTDLKIGHYMVAIVVSWMGRQFHPGGVLFGGIQDCGYELDSRYAVFDCGDQQGFRVGLAVGLAGGNLLG
jgi:hypothetical protein